jgi:CO/xanthine dehydrogenase FAD-binding subunit
VVADSSGTLADPSVSAEVKDELMRTLTASASPITDVRGGREYREAMLLTMSRRALAAALSMRERSR